MLFMQSFTVAASTVVQTSKNLGEFYIDIGKYFETGFILTENHHYNYNLTV